MSVESNKSLVRRALEQIAGDLTGAGKLFATDFVRHLPGGMENRGRGAFLEAERAAVEGIGNMTVTILDIFGEADRVAVRIRTDGIHSGTLLGFPPTGNQFSITALGIFRISDDKIAEMWEELDINSWVAQLQKQ